MRGRERRTRVGDDVLVGAKACGRSPSGVGRAYVREREVRERAGGEQVQAERSARVPRFSTCSHGQFARYVRVAQRVASSCVLVV